MKRCCTCKEEKALANFYNNRSRPDGKANSCKPCTGIFRQRWRESGKERQYKYGITPGEYAQRLYEQNDKCAICQEETELVVDHDHATGNVRGLLCGLCNRGLGSFKDDRSSLLRAADYLDAGAQ